MRLAANSARTISNDIIIPPSSKGLSSRPLTTFTPSIPSYPSPKTDLSWDSSDFGVQIFSYCDLEEATDNFDRSRELGDGGFGTVYYGMITSPFALFLMLFLILPTWIKIGNYF